MQVRASHILVDTFEQAQALKQQIDEGADFGDLARSNSKCPSASSNGDLGEFGPGQMVPPFELAAFNTPVNSVSLPVKTQFGYHLILRTA
jgi:peptidyl-prolyl cis-trans isomerase C